MKTLIKLSLKYLKRQKLRTFLTFLSITIGVFVISLGILFFTSLQKSLYNEILSLDQIEVDISNSIIENEMIPDSAGDKNSALIENTKKLRNHYLTEDSSTEIIFRFTFNDSINISCDKKDNIKSEAIYLDSLNGNPNYNKYPIYSKFKNNYRNDIIKNSNGIILPDYFEELGYKINDYIDFTFYSSDNSGSFTTEKYIIEGFNEYFLIDATLFVVKDNDKLISQFYNTFSDNLLEKNCIERFNVKKRTFQSYKNNLKTIFSDCNFIINDEILDSGIYDSMLLLYSGKYIFNKNNIPELIVIVLYFVLFLLFGIFIIKNSFESSAYERIHKYNTLKMVGASQDQLTAMTSIEAFLFSIISIPLGNTISYFLLKSILSKYNYIRDNINILINPVFHAQFIGIIICITVVVLSSYKTAIVSSKKYTLNQAANLGSIVKKENKKNALKNSSVSKLIKTYSKRNMKRTRGKYLFSSFCCIISAGILSASVFSYIIVPFNKNEDDGFTEKDIYAADYQFNIISRTTMDQINQIFAPIKSECNIEIEERYSYLLVVSSDEIEYKDYTNDYKLFVEAAENEPYYDILDKYYGIPYNRSIIDIDVFDKKEYEDKYQQYTNISYEEMIRERYVLLKKSSEEKNAFYSYKDMGYAEAPDFIKYYFDKNKMDFKIYGFIEIDDKYSSVVIPEENAKHLYISYATVNINEIEGHDHEKISELVYKIESENLNKIGFVDDFYTKRIQEKNRRNANIQSFVSVLLLFTASGIISLINTTNTRILNTQREYYIFRCSGMNKKYIIKSVLREILVFSWLPFLLGSIIGPVLICLLVHPEFSVGSLFIIAAVMLIVLFILFALYIMFPILSTIPLIKRMFNTSSEIVNSNLIR